MLAQLILASFPGRFCGGEEKRPGHHCWRMRVVPIKTWEFVHVCTLSAYTLVISRNISVHDHERLATALTGSGVKLCFEKTLNMPFLAYYGCSKLLKAHAWGTHTRFTVSVGIDLSLTKTRRTRSADCIRMDKRARISPLWEIVYYSDTCIVYLAVRETEYFTEILRNISRMREQWPFFSSPAKKTAWERG